ncbi:MAG: ATPase domain-containing protein [Casimicrobiaceae bacterium]
MADADAHDARLPTGIKGLDEILGGGLWRGAVYLVQGSPGAGKTILANQVCAAAARRGGRALYVSLLAESFTGMLQHLSRLEFFEPADIGDRILYVSGFAAFEEGGVAGIVSLVRGEARRYDAEVVVIDALLSASDASTPRLQYKRRLLDLQATGAMTGFTTLMLATPAETGDAVVAMQIADGIIELFEESDGRRAERTLAVRKFRGGATLHGRHAFEIDRRGITVYPRLEAGLAESEPASDAERLGTGIPALDTMLHGGLPAATTTCLIGSPGSGKTALGLQFLAQCTPDAPGLLFGFYESPDVIRAGARSLGFDFSALEAAGALRIEWQAQGEHILDGLAHRLLATVDAIGARRVVIDGYEPFTLTHAHEGRMTPFMTALSIKLRHRRVTSIITIEQPDLFERPMRTPLQSSSSIFDNVVVMRHLERRGRLVRLLAIGKLRGSGFALEVRTFDITANGITIGEEWSPEAFAEGPAGNQRPPR